MNTRSTRVKLISFAIILILLLISFNTDTASILIAGDPDALQDLSHRGIVMLMLFSLLLMMIQNIFPVIPLLLLISVNVSVFGFTLGYIWSLLISIVGAIFTFVITRYWFQIFFDKYVSGKTKLKIEEKGFWFVFIGRVLPIMPTSVINIAAGVSSVRFRTFLYATILGNMVYVLVLSLITQGILSIQLESHLLVTITVLLLIAFIIMKFWKRKQIDQQQIKD